MPLIAFVTKTCFKCNTDKPLVEFYRHSKMGDGRLNKCKDCAKTDVARNRFEKLEYYSDYERRRNQTPERRLKRKQYKLIYNVVNVKKYKARNLVNNALRDGRIQKQPCQYCGTNEKVQAHHRDYSKPLEVIWTCFRCHREQEHGQKVVSPAPF